MKAESNRLSSLRDDLESGILSAVDGIRVNGNLKSRLPHTSHVTIDGIEAEGLLVSMGDVALSTGSACTSASVEPSHVLKAMGFENTEVFGSVRMSLGRFTRSEEIAHVVERFREVVAQLRELRQLA
jgi:cysteine desulfurase